MRDQDSDDLQFCRWALDSEVSVADAAQALFANHEHPEDPWDVGIPEVEALYNLVMAIEVAGIPLGESRRYWNPQALEQKDKLKAEIEEKHRADAMCAFQAIINEYTRVGLPRGCHAWPRSTPQERQ